ncbi:reverse transcriptase domain-containing protein [Klebsiella pneumoniae]|uniref:reverse transcriptase domain-containing protein n=1 Tax=Klebsiella pneumoniae TaxID=573 RepID=UPI0035BF9CAC
MMYGEEKSDSLIVAAKQANNPKGAESVERRSGAKGNAEQPHMRRTQSRESMSQRLSRVREAAKQRKKERFTALFHLLTVEALEAAFLSLSRKAAAGVDGIRWMDYAGNMKNNITDLHRRLHQGSYRAQPGRRHYIPKADGKQRPLGIASLEDKIVQYALVKILNAVYENDFMGFSYGFRPGRSQHDALDALATGLVRTNVNWVLDADISQFFDRVSHEWLIRFTEHRIGDRRVIRLIRKWLTAGTSEEGQWRATEEGTPQGAVISPLLANIYLHYVFDLWAHQWRRRYATGNVVMVRYADDIVIGFDKRYDAHYSIPEQGKWLRRVVQGYLNYHSVPGNFPTMQKFRTHVTNLWRRALRRRSQKDDTTWTKANKLAAAWLPRVRVLHPWPVERFTARHPRQEPGA